MDNSAAVGILTRGVDLDMKGKYSDAIICYQEGIQLLINSLKNEPEAKQKYIRQKIDEYMSRAEKLKTTIEQRKISGKGHEQIDIKSDGTGYSYGKIFGRFLGIDVRQVTIEDPYVRAYHQCQNFARCCDLFVTKCPNLKKIQLLTKLDTNGEQNTWLKEIKDDLRCYQVELCIDYSNTLHDRKISIGNGWIIKIGRGLDYFKAPSGKMTLDNFNMDLRKCHETTIDIFNTNDVHLS